MHEPSTVQKLAAEVIGTAFLVFIGVGVGPGDAHRQRRRARSPWPISG